MGLLSRLSAWARAARGRVALRVLLLGLDRSGKSALLAALRDSTHDGHDAHDAQRGHDTRASGPMEHFHSGGVSFSAWDVSGAARHRALWERHYRAADAIVFVVDAADHLRLVVAREELQLAAAHPDVRGRRLPLLVLANKSDAPHALPPTHLAAALGLERIAELPWHVCASCALTGAGVADGLAWLARQLRDAHVARARRTHD